MNLSEISQSDCAFLSSSNWLLGCRLRIGLEFFLIRFYKEKKSKEVENLSKGVIMILHGV